MVVLPVTVEIKNDAKQIELHEAKEIQGLGYLNASKWFSNVENIWRIHRTEKNQIISSENYLNWQNKLTEQNLNDPFVVLYNTSGKDANSVVLERNKFDLEFLADHKTYIFTTALKKDAYYLSAILNSSAPNKMMKDFQSRGLFGARDVHKKILDVFYPKFNEKSKVHKQLAQLSEQAHEKAKAYLIANVPKQELSAIFLGRLRTEIKKHLKEEMEEIDELVKEVIKS